VSFSEVLLPMIKQTVVDQAKFRLNLHPGSNLIFDVGVIYLRLIIFLVVGDVLIDSETFF
jgi:hypothetical protein